MDRFQTYLPGLNTPADSGYAVTPSDSTDLTVSTRGFICGASGDVKVDFVGTGTATLKGLMAGVIYPIRAKRIYATGTTATDIVALY